MGLFNRFKKAEEEIISEAPPVKKPDTNESTPRVWSPG